MARRARIMSPTGIYHAVIRGIDGLFIFPGSGEKREYFNKLQEVCGEGCFALYAYCFMDNHAHFILQEQKLNISQIMHCANSSYGMYFNRKYNRRGPVFNDRRFWSEPLTTTESLLDVAKYIHNNPVDAGLVKEPENYYWSSYRLYLAPEGAAFSPPFRRDFILDVIAEDFQEAVSLFREFTLERKEEIPLNQYIELFLREKRLSRDEFAGLPRRIRDPLLREIFKETKATVAELATALEIGRDILYRAKR